MKLTKKQEAIFDYLRDFRDRFHYMPTTRDIQDHFKFASQTAAVNHLKAIEAKGFIQRRSKRARAITIVRYPDKSPAAHHEPLVNENEVPEKHSSVSRSS